MKHIFLTLALLIGTTLVAQVNQTDAQGRKQGQWEKKYENSNQVRYRGEFHNDIPIGTFTYFHQSGARLSVIEYRGETGVGYATMYERGGWKMAEGIFVNEKRDSTWRYYGPDGDLVSTVNWKKGEKDGVETILYHDGSIAETITWAAGVKEGEWVQKFPDGSTRARGVYANGRLHGDVMYYGQEGRPEYIGSYVNGLKDGNWYIFKGGRQHIKEIYDMGTLLDSECLNSEGCPELEESETDE
ncbi:MAG: hypothetical protein EP346_06375 [Bacteroidetes bacterium]|nr:MAG: hypothetical protein EP346_06375 [Bacteroidota bacterium]